MTLGIQLAFYLLSSDNKAEYHKQADENPKLQCSDNTKASRGTIRIASMISRGARYIRRVVELAKSMRSIGRGNGCEYPLCNRALSET